MASNTLAHYEIIDSIGAGGMGEVFRARDTKLGRNVALKVLHENVRSDPDRLARLQQEARAVAALSHPNIVAIYELGTHEGSSYVAMELLEGEPLDARLEQGPIPPRKAIEIAGQIADGLAAAHERGVVHRDLKPANIFLTSTGRAKILDFGLARLDEPDSTSLPHAETRAAGTAPGTVMGTSGYMSPEQVRGRDVDARSDIFSFGTVLYEMLTGTYAFSGDSAADVMGSILRDETRSLRDSNPDLPDALDRLVHHCLEKRPEERFQSARDLAFALRNASTSSGTATVPTLEDEATKRRGPSVSTRWRIAAVLGWLAFLIAIGVFTSEQSSVPSPPRLSTLSFSGRDWAPSASPDGKLVAFVSDRDGTSRIWLKQLATGSETPLTEGPDDDYPRFSPDGSQVLFSRRGVGTRDLYRVAVVGGTPRRMLDNVQEADWSPDGRRVAFLRNSADETASGITVGIADVQSGEERSIGSGGAESWYGPRWSPDGKWIAVAEGPFTGSVIGRSGIKLLDVDTGDVRDVEAPGFSGLYTSVEWSPNGKSFILGRAIHILSHTLGSPSAILQYDLESGTAHTLCWAAAREPRAGWGSTTYGVLGPTRMVLDEQVVMAELRAVEWSRFGEEGAERTITSGFGRDRQPAFHPDGTHVLFSSNRSGNIDLWAVDMTTGDVQQVTDDPADDWDPAYTPDGRSIIWSSSRGGNMEIWMANVDGSGPRQVSSDGSNAENATMTGDGTWIVYTSSNEEKAGLWKIRPDGSEATLVTPGSTLLPEVSPNGDYVLFVRVRSGEVSIETADLETGEVVPFRIDFNRAWRAENVVFGRARWMPDGTGIIYIDQNDEGRVGVTRQDFAIGEDTSDSRRPMAGFSPHYAAESLAISPDGKTVIVSAMFARRSLKLVEDVELRDWK